MAEKLENGIPYDQHKKDVREEREISLTSRDTSDDEALITIILPPLQPGPKSIPYGMLPPFPSEYIV